MKQDSFENRLRVFAETMSAISGDSASMPEPEPPRPSAGSPPAIRTPTPVAPASPLALRVARLIAELAKAARRVHRHADAEAIHDLRVASRRLIAILRLWSGLFRDGSRRRAFRRLRALRRRLGPARELEVHVELLEGLARPPSQASQAALDFLLRDLRRRLARARQEAADRVRPRRLRSLIETIERASGRIDERLTEMPETVQRARTRAKRHALEAITALNRAIARRDDSSFHEARIAVKKWRYAEEALSVLPGTGDHPSLDSMRELQDLLGVIQDCASLRDRIVPDPSSAGETLGPLAPVIHALEAQRRPAMERAFSVIPAFLRRMSTAVLD